MKGFPGSTRLSFSRRTNQTLILQDKFRSFSIRFLVRGGGNWERKSIEFQQQKKSEQKQTVFSQASCNRTPGTERDTKTALISVWFTAICEHANTTLGPFPRSPATCFNEEIETGRRKPENKDSTTRHPIHYGRNMESSWLPLISGSYYYY